MSCLFVCFPVRLALFVSLLVSFVLFVRSVALSEPQVRDRRGGGGVGVVQLLPEFHHQRGDGLALGEAQLRLPGGRRTVHGTPF